MTPYLSIVDAISCVAGVLIRKSLHLKPEVLQLNAISFPLVVSPLLIYFKTLILINERNYK